MILSIIEQCEGQAAGNTGEEADEQKAGRIMGNSFALILISAAVLTFVGYAFSRLILFAFGASEESFVYAKKYLDIYLVYTEQSLREKP